MGNRRIGRKRLYAVEKKGQKVSLEAGAGIKDAIVSATQHRQGLEIITEIQVDLGASGMLGGQADNAAIAKSAAAAHLTRLTVAKFGIITEIRAVVAEQVVGGGVSSNEVNVASSTSALSQGTGTATARIEGLNTKGVDSSYTPNDSSTLQTSSSEHYLYITNGGSDTSEDPVTAGKLCIYIHGFVEPDDA
tara:strand:- start:57 stop:629 length:573 start_codon:yes stop_codon:yes gene_type:complete